MAKRATLTGTTVARVSALVQIEDAREHDEAAKGDAVCETRGRPTADSPDFRPAVGSPCVTAPTTIPT